MELASLHKVFSRLELWIILCVDLGLSLYLENVHFSLAKSKVTIYVQMRINRANSRPE